MLHHIKIEQKILKLWRSMNKKHTNIITFVGFVRGLTAPSLESQYFDEYVKLGDYVDNVIIVSGDVSGDFQLPSNVKLVTVPVSKIPKFRGISKIFFYAILPFKMRKQINLIYVRTMSPSDIISFWLTRSLLKIPGILLVGGTCFYEPLNFKNRIYRWLYSQALTSSNKIVVYSKLMIPHVKKINKKIPESKFEIIHNAVDTKRFHKTHPSDDVLKKIKNNDEKIILFVGKINERKGVLDVIDVIPKLQTQNVRAVFIGSFEKNSSEFKRIQEKMQILNLHDKISFLGKIPNNDLPNYLSCADVMVYLTKACEGIPRAILEAMACGLPVISTVIAGIPDAVINGKTGFIVNNTSEAAEKIDFLFKNPNEYQKISNNCQKIIKDEFTYDVTLPKLTNLFTSVLVGNST